VSKDWDYIARVEKSIKRKYGEDAVINPKGNWDDEKEKDYLEALKEQYRRSRNSAADKVELNGVFVPRKLLIKDSKRKCPVCDVYSFNTKDDVYMSKFDCCYGCYVQWVEHREERWDDGWRPNKEE